jgi:hypothetical protein
MEEMSVLRLTGEALPPRMTASFMTVCFQNQEESRAQRPLAGLRCLWAECYAQGAASSAPTPRIIRSPASEEAGYKDWGTYEGRSDCRGTDV